MGDQLGQAISVTATNRLEARISDIGDNIGTHIQRGATVAGAAISALAVLTSRNFEDIGRQAANVQLPTEQFSQFSTALEQFGVDTGDVRGAVNAQIAVRG